MGKNKKEEGPYSAFVSDMLKKAQGTDNVAKPQTLMTKDVKKDPGIKSVSLYMKDEDVKKVEDEVKKIKDKIR